MTDTDDTDGFGIDRPDWLPDEYDPDGPLLERIRIAAEIPGGIELHARGDNGVVEIVGAPQHKTDSRHRFWLACGRRDDDWEWEIVIPKKDGVPPSLMQVDPQQSETAYSATKTHWFQIDDVRIYGVDVSRLEVPADA